MSFPSSLSSLFKGGGANGPAKSGSSRRQGEQVQEEEMIDPIFDYQVLVVLGIPLE